MRLQIYFLFILLFLFYQCTVLNKETNHFKDINIETGLKVEELVKHFFKANLDNYEISEEYVPSISQNERIRFLILHYTAIDMKTSIRALTKGEVSSHYLISDSIDNKIHLLVTEDKRAWHAGVSSFKGFSNINDNSIGIEIVNKGYSIDSLGERKFYTYPNHQVKKIAELVKDISTRYKIDSTYILGHSDIAPQRKFDPGPLFPWKELYENHKIGAWYSEIDKNEFLLLYSTNIYNSKEFITSVQENLAKYGYEILITGEWDLQTNKVIQSFQYHFNPNAIKFGVLDQETWSILMALNKKYRK